MSLDQLLEALLFFNGEAMSIVELSRLAERTPEEVTAAITILEERLLRGGTRLMQHNGAVMLRAAPEAATRIEDLRKNELSKDLGKAGLETLAVVLYRGPVSRAEIDLVRGVNSQSMLRNLQVRGLVAKTTDPQNPRTVLYTPTLELLSFLGVTKVADLPEFDVVAQQVGDFVTDTQTPT